MSLGGHAAPPLSDSQLTKGADVLSRGFATAVLCDVLLRGGAVVRADDKQKPTRERAARAVGTSSSLCFRLRFVCKVARGAGRELVQGIPGVRLGGYGLLVTGIMHRLNRLSCAGSGRLGANEDGVLAGWGWRRRGGKVHFQLLLNEHRVKFRCV